MTVASDHLWLSPSNRLLADDPSIKSYTYDAAGHTITLPPNVTSGADLPLIVLGADTTLRIVNARIHNARSLSACLSLAPGARLLLDPLDAVTLIDDPPDHLADPNNHPNNPNLLAPTSSRGGSVMASAYAAASAQTPAVAFAGLQVDVNAVGLGVHLVAPQRSTGDGSAGYTLGGGNGNHSSGHAHILAAYADLQATYGSREGKDNASLCIRGLRVQSQIAPRDKDAAAATAAAASAAIPAAATTAAASAAAKGASRDNAAADPTGAASAAGVAKGAAASTAAPTAAAAAFAATAKGDKDAHGSAGAAVTAVRGAGLLQGQVLEPTDLLATYSSTPDAQDVAVEITDMNFHVSPDVLALLVQVQSSLLAPVSAASKTQPLRAVRAYSKVRRFLDFFALLLPVHVSLCSVCWLPGFESVHLYQYTRLHTHKRYTNGTRCPNVSPLVLFVPDRYRSGLLALLHCRPRLTLLPLCPSLQS